MSDAMQVAHQNRKDHKRAIAQKEAEIAELREMITDLDSFIEFGNSLLGGEATMPIEDQVATVKNAAPMESGQNWNSGDVHDGIADVLKKRAG